MNAHVRPLVNSAYAIGHLAPDNMQDILRNAMAASVPRHMRPIRAGTGKTNAGAVSAKTLEDAAKAQRLRAAGLTYKETAAILDLSENRIGQLLKVTL